ncbi:hypothetical protein GQ42DRAFT_181939 [Ramicandelaber brevisporus]|nr:hypothetical protein GQ42DRAFT_181939 [Ramicandelaber brevisporus]
MSKVVRFKHIYVSPDLAKSVHDQRPGSAEYPDAGEGHYKYPCDSQIDITLTFAGTAFPISVALFNRGPVSEGSSDCLSGIVGTGSDNIALIGTVYLENVYTEFSLDPLYVGFAKLA